MRFPVNVLPLLVDEAVSQEENIHAQRVNQFKLFLIEGFEDISLLASMAFLSL